MPRKPWGVCTRWIQKKMVVDAGKIFQFVQLLKPRFDFHGVRIVLYSFGAPSMFDDETSGRFWMSFTCKR